MMKRIALLIIFLICISSALAYNFRTIWNPFGNHLDYYTTGNFTGENVTFDDIMPSATLTYDIGSGALRWDNLFVRTVNTEGLSATDNITTTGNFVGNIDASYVQNEYWVNESGDTMTGNLSAPNFVGNLVGNTTAWSTDLGNIWPTRFDQYGSFSTVQLGIGTNDPAYEIEVVDYAPVIAVIGNENTQPSKIILGDSIIDSLFAITTWPSAALTPSLQGDTTLIAWDDLSLTSLFAGIQFEAASGIYDLGKTSGVDAEVRIYNSSAKYISIGHDGDGYIDTSAGDLVIDSQTHHFGVGTLASDPDGMEVQATIDSESQLNKTYVKIGIHDGTPRIIMEDDGFIPWEIDSGENLRFFQVGHVYATLSTEAFKLATTSEFIGKQNWTDNQNYPAGCSAGSAVTAINDTLTCVSYVNVTSFNATTITVSGNITASYLNANVPWNNLTDYPVACPAYSAITQLNDSVTCTNYELVSTFNDTGSMYVKDNIFVGNGTSDNFLSLTSGNLFVSRVLEVARGIWSKPYQYGFIMQAQDYDFATYYTSFTGDATFDGTNYFICDDVNDPFTIDFEDKFLTVTSSIPDYAGATGEIEEYINDTCVRINVAAAGGESVADATNFKFVVYPHPRFAVLDEGYSTISVGESPDAKFEIHVFNGTGSESMLIDDKSGAEQHKSLVIQNDMNGYSGAIGLNSHMFSTAGVPATAPIRANNLKLEIKADNINASVLNYMVMSQIGVVGKNTEINGIRVDPSVNHIIEMGDVDLINRSYYEATDVTDLRTGVAHQVFTADNGVLYVGSSVNFTRASFSLSIPSSADILSLYWYCNNTNNWQTMTGVLDTTAGFTISGGISFNPISKRGTCNKQLDGTPFADTANYTYIGIQRTRNTLTRPPTISRAGIAGAGSYFILQKDMINFQPAETAPEDCTAEFLGAMYFDISEDNMCQCKSTGWKVIADGSACT